MVSTVGWSPDHPLTCLNDLQPSYRSTIERVNQHVKNSIREQSPRMDYWREGLRGSATILKEIKEKSHKRKMSFFVCSFALIRSQTRVIRLHPSLAFDKLRPTHVASNLCESVNCSSKSLQISKDKATDNLKQN